MPVKKEKEYPCFVVSIDSCIAIPINDKTRGGELLDAVCRQLGVYEKQWFGLHYTNQSDNSQWLEVKDKVNLKHIKLIQGSNAHYNFTIRYYPECIKGELIQDIVKTLFFKHELSRIISDPDVYVTPEELVLACVAYACLVNHENPSMPPEQVIEKKFDRLFPKHVLARYDLSKSDWEDAIFSALSVAQTQHYTESILQCLNFMEQSPMYGITYHAIKNKKGTNLYIGLDCYGINIYKASDRVNPVINFLWSEVHSVGYEGKVFRITMVEKNAKPFEFYAKSEVQCKQMLICVEGNHKNFLSRRRSQENSSVEIREAQKAQEVEDLKKKKFEEQKKSEMEYAATVEHMVNTGRVDDKKADMMKENYENARKLMEEQMREANKLAEEERKRKEQAEKEMERLKAEAAKMANKLSEEEENRRRMIELENERIIKEKTHINEIDDLKRRLQELELKHQEDLKRIEEIKNKAAASGADGAGGAGTGSGGAGAGAGASDVPKPVSYEEIKKRKNAEMKDKMEKFGTLAKSKNKNNSQQAAQVEQFSSGGKSKFDTLKMLRKNNTRARIDEFESL